MADRSPEMEPDMELAVAPMPPATGELAPGVLTRLSPSVRRIVAPNPSLMTGPGTNTYLIGDGDLIVVDPGPADDAHLDRIAEAGAGRIRTIVVTHTHPDHAPGAAGLAERTGATVVGFGERDGFTPDVAAGDGFRAGPLRAVHTPGHASNHLCFLHADEGLLFSGDHIMNGSTVVIAPPDGDMAAYVDQLQRLRHLDVSAIAPGHGALITDPAAKIDEYVAHRAEREAQIAAALDGRPGSTVEALVDAVYVGLVDALRPVAKYSAWAHLRKLAAAGRAQCDDVDDLSAEWSPPTRGGRA